MDDRKLDRLMQAVLDGEASPDEARELELVLHGRQARSQALERYAAFCEDKRHAYRGMLRAQRFVGRANPHPLMTTVLEASGGPRTVHRAFNRYRDICPPPVTPVHGR